MIKPILTYPGQTATDANYPYGKAQNVVSVGDGTGTPLEQAWVNDVFGFFQALVVAAGIVPSNVPESATSSDVLNAMNALLTTACNTVAVNAAAALKAAKQKVQAKNWAERASLTNGHASLNATIPIAHDASGSIGVLGGNRYVALASSFSFTSEDGLTWSPGGSFGASVNPKMVAAGNVGGVPSFLTGDAATNAMFASVDGISWAASGSTTDPMSCLINALPILPWVVGGDSGKINTSTDGSTWVNRVVPVGYAGKEIRQFATNGTTIVGITSASYNKFITSTDGINWTERTLGTTQVWNCIAYDATDGIFIALGASAAYKSTDGITWTAIAFPSGGAISLASDGLGLWVATTGLGAFGGVVFSIDKGATWTNVSVGSHLTVTGYPRVIFAQNRFVMARSSSTALEFALSQRGA